MAILDLINYTSEGITLPADVFCIILSYYASVVDLHSLKAEYLFVLYVMVSQSD